MKKIDLTKEEFELLPVGQKFIESCCSGSSFVKAIKISETEIEKIEISSHNFSASCEKKKFNPKYDWLQPVEFFENVNGEIQTFEQLKKLFNVK